MKNYRPILRILLNGIFFLIVVVFALSVATIALTKKVNETHLQYYRALKGTVMKQSVPILSFSRGIVIKINVKTGQEVKKGDLLVDMENPLLEDQLKVFQQFQDNQSAQAEAGLTRANLNNLNLFAPVDGVIGDILVSEGSSIDAFTKVMVIYSSKDVRVFSELTDDQFQNLQKYKDMNAYSSRINQNFIIVPTLLKPDEKTPLNFEQKKVGMYFTFKNPIESKSLLNNEDLSLSFNNPEENTRKPIDIFVDFWNGLISRPIK